MNKDVINKFFRTQKIIMVVGLMLTLISFTVGYLFFKPNTPMIILGLVIIILTFLICDILETRFRKKFVKVYGEEIEKKVWSNNLWLKRK